MFVFIGGEDMLVPEEGEIIICEGWGRQGREGGDGAVEEHGNAAFVNRVGE